MTLKPCRVCGHSVAWEAKTCPSCGAKNPGMGKMINAMLYGFALVVALIVFASIV